MGFFFNQTREEAAKARTSSRSTRMPVETMQAMQCSACPRNKDKALRNPKLPFSGATKPLYVVLGPTPTRKDDQAGEYLVSRDHDILLKLFSRQQLERDVAMLGLTQCAGDEHDAAAVTCCTDRVRKTIEDLQPLVVFALGRHATEWATGLGGGSSIRGGRLIPTWFGRHQAWVMSLPDSDWKGLKAGNYGPSNFAKLYHKQVREVIKAVDRGLEPPDMPKPGTYLDGIVCISGQNPGDIDRLERELRYLATLPDVGIDYETNALRPYHRPDPHIWCCSVGTFEHTVAFSLDMPDGWPTQELRTRAWAAFINFLICSKLKIAHNLSMEHTWTAWEMGYEILRSTQWADTMAQAHTLDERKGTKSLDDCVRMHFGFFPKPLTNVDPVKLLQYPMEKRLVYNAIDTKWSHALYHAQKKLIDQNSAYVWEYERKVKLCPTLVITELLGLPTDSQRAQELHDEFQGKSQSALRKLMACPEVRSYERKFGKFEPSSSDQVLKLYRDIMGRREVEVHRDGEVTYTTGEDALAQMPPEEVPSAKLILEWRGAEKLVSTYLQPILEKRIVHADGCMHPVYNSMEAVTGRLSSEDPNGQNWPKRKNKEIRSVVYAPKGHTFAAKDYGQIEARVIGMASEDKALCKALWTGYDIHGYWCDRVLAKYPKWADWLSKEFEVDRGDDAKIRKTGRQEAKNKWVFPQFFGSNFKSCAADLHVPLDIAEDLMQEFWSEFAGVKRWQEKLIQRYERDMYVETLTGRRRRGAMSKNEIINTPIQGTAADIVTEAMNALSEEAVLIGDLTLHPRLNVHDDLSSIPRTEDLDDHIQRCVRIMCQHRFDFINVPLVVEVETGPNWYDLKKYGEFRSDKLFNLVCPY